MDSERLEHEIRDLKLTFEENDVFRTAISDLFDISAPIIQAPIWPAASPELAAAVCRAGALGSIAAVFGSADRVRQHIARVRQLTDRPFAVNHVVPYLDEDAFAATLEARPAVISTSLGDPGTLVERAHAAGAKLVHQVHTVEQGRQAAARGVDAIIGQGGEGGGQGMALGVSTMALIPQLVDAVAPIPVIAAGGIADGRGVAAALVLGAAGVNVGTRFIASREASAAQPWQDGVVAAQSEDVVRFEAWSDIFPPAGENAYRVSPRVLAFPLVEEWRRDPEGLRQRIPRLREELTALVREHRLDKVLPFAGQSAGMIEDVRTAEEIVTGMIAEAEQALARAAQLERR
jgi:nitronate monooxygenase/enoyl-[acyl-carrier protein] reductase II